MKQTIVISEDDYSDSIYNTIEWEHSVIIVRWEHDYENKRYTIDFKTID